jgi:cyclophilin family peptidyl-prolyl cis-trans isomerase
LQTIEITLEDMVGNNLAHVSLSTEISGVDLYSAYSGVLGVVGAWKATNKKTGATIAITSVSANAGNSQFYITLNQAAVNAMDPGDKIGLTLVATDVLAAAPYNVDGFEGKELIIAVPAS